MTAGCGLIDRVRREHKAPMRIALLGDLSDATTPYVYEYSWDRPLGLVVAEGPVAGSWMIPCSATTPGYRGTECSQTTRPSRRRSTSC